MEIDSEPETTPVENDATTQPSSLQLLTHLRQIIHQVYRHTDTNVKTFNNFSANPALQARFHPLDLDAGLHNKQYAQQFQSILQQLQQKHLSQQLELNNSMEGDLKGNQRLNTKMGLLRNRQDARKFSVNIYIIIPK